MRRARFFVLMLLVASVFAAACLVLAYDHLRSERVKRVADDEARVPGGAIPLASPRGITLARRVAVHLGLDTSARPAPPEPTLAAPGDAGRRYPQSRHPAAVAPGLSPESRRLWESEGSTTYDIDRAYALDVCSCSSLECIAAIQVSFYNRRTRALRADPSPHEEAAIRNMRNDCQLRLSRLEYREASNR
jgi:hypothetical protein